MNKPTRKVAVGPGEQALSAKADKMLQAGNQSFNSVYGDKAPFDPKADQAELEAAGFDNGAGIPLSSDPNDALPSPALPVQPQVAPQAPADVPPPPQTPAITQASGTSQEGQEEKLPMDPVELIKKICGDLKLINPNAPSAQMVFEWKQLHGNVFLLNIESHVFIYRYLKRQEWIQINANPRFNEMLEHQVEEMIFDKCVLWPKEDATTKAGFPAGTMNMIVQQIRLQSLFLDPAYVAQMTIKM